MPASGSNENRAPSPSWRVRDVRALRCDECGVLITSARCEVGDCDVRFTCPWHELPRGMRHPLEQP